ncbi:hypothetical protein [Sphaerisporangium sp. NPDC051011]|uniref:hypothetical protein n=1 Tax=Sphaerisporangium sp. NPDC051011 TaxID=3155792 RepID=UPI00340EA5BC
MANEYLDLDTFKLALSITDMDRDLLLHKARAAASRAIDKRTGRRFWLDDAASTRTYNPGGRVVCDESGARLLVDDIGDAAGLIVETGFGGSWTAVTGYETGPDNALARGRAITALVLPSGTWGFGTTRVRVTARWGWPAVPDDIAQAALIQAARLYRRKDSPEGVAGSAEWGLIRLPPLDPDVRLLVAPYELPGFG